MGVGVGSCEVKDVCMYVCTYVARLVSYSLPCCVDSFEVLLGSSHPGEMNGPHPTGYTPLSHFLSQKQVTTSTTVHLVAYLTVVR